MGARPHRGRGDRGRGSMTVHESGEPAESGSWVLVRLDDNGNEVEMFRFHHERDAIATQRVYEARGHKQAYFVRRLRPGSESGQR